MQESKNTYLHVEGQSSSLEELIRGCSRNERGAQEAMYKQFYGRMMGVVRRYIDYPEQAEEVLNNGFLRAFQKIDQYTYKGSFEGWLRKIVFHAVADYVKQHAKYNTQIVLVEKDQLIKKDLADNLYYDQLLALIQTLPSSTRSVFNMYVLDGYPHKEIADILGISEGTSKWHLSEGRRILREKIEKLNLHIK
ncbi:MAG: sigma-70 family RNA polymerase sigma factor [Bacteroidota bacterium]|nr:sigma-70 family RNA polymerase sigma factor [Bacteroidota bacterium]